MKGPREKALSGFATASCCQGCCGEAAPSQAVHARPALSWEFPLPRVHTGVTLGNGVQGLLIWGVDRLSLTISRAGFWDHRGGTPFAERIDYRKLRELLSDGDELEVLRAFSPCAESDGGSPKQPQQLSGGRLDLIFPDGIRPRLATFCHGTGEVTVHLANDEGRNVILVIRQAIDMELAWVTVPEELKAVIGVHLVAQWDLIGEEMAGLGIHPPEWWNHGTEFGFHQPLPNDPGLSLACCRRGGGEIISVATALGDDPAPGARSLACLGDLDGAHVRASAWWRGYWNSVPHIDLSDPALSWMHEYGLLKQAGLTNPHGIAATLQGPWMEECRIPPWSNDYHFNINLELIYWPALSTGCFRHLAPLWDLMRKMMPRLREHGERFFGRPGAVMLPHAIDDRGTAIGSYWQGTIDHGATAWMALLAWLHWRYDGDQAVLADIAWPLLNGTFEGYWSMLEERHEAGGNDRLTLPVSVSPEYGEGSFIHGWGRDASFQLAALQCVARILPKAAAALECAVDARWGRIENELPQYSSMRELPEEELSQICIWEGQPLAISHRHHSHLAGIYPFATLDWRDPEHARTIDHSLYIWSTRGAGGWCAWCLPWAAIICARTNRAEAAVAWLNWLYHTCANEGGSLGMAGPCGAGSDWAGADWGRRNGIHEFMQLDANLGVVTAIHELLVQCTSRGIEVLPSIPVRWKDFSFDGIHAEGGFVIGASVRDGKLAEVRVHSRRGGRLVLWHGMKWSWGIDGDAVDEGPSLAIEMHRGQTLIIRTGQRPRE